MRDALFDLAARQLAPNGVMYVSYNTFPGCRVRQAAWDILRYHAADATRARDRLEVPVTSRLATSGELRGRPFIGIAPVTKDLRYEYPVDITIDPGAVSGPSAGLAFTLAIIDGFLVSVGEGHYVIPLDQVLECIEFPSARRDNYHQFLMLRDGVIVFEGDADALRQSTDPYIKSFLS